VNQWDLQLKKQHSNYNVRNLLLNFEWSKCGLKSKVTFETDLLFYFFIVCIIKLWVKYVFSPYKYLKFCFLSLSIFCPQIFSVTTFDPAFYSTHCSTNVLDTKIKYKWNVSIKIEHNMSWSVNINNSLHDLKIERNMSWSVNIVQIHIVQMTKETHKCSIDTYSYSTNETHNRNTQQKQTKF
jgi:hypothetical protein